MAGLEEPAEASGDRLQKSDEAFAYKELAHVPGNLALLKIYRRGYKRRFAWIRAGKISQETFNTWRRDAQMEKREIRERKNSKVEFTQWLCQNYQPHKG